MEEKSDLEKLGQRARRVPLFVRLPIILAAFFLAGYWIYSDSGPYYWIANWQASFLDGEHYIAISWLFTILICVIPAAIIVQLLARLIKNDQV